MAVICRGRPVGYLPRVDASRYAAPIGDLAVRGLALHVRARVWVGTSTTWDDSSGDYSTRPNASVRLALPEPHLLGPVNSPPAEPYAVLPYGSAIQVTGEENHREAIASLLRPDGDCWTIATLHRAQIDGARGTKSVTEVRIDGSQVGALTPKMSSETLPAIDFLADRGAVAAVRARVKGNRIKAEVALYCCRAHEIPDSWFSNPTCRPNDWSPFGADEDARMHIDARPARARQAPQLRRHEQEIVAPPTNQATTRSSPPPDWYPDPGDVGQWRYWDGASWTMHSAPMRRSWTGRVTKPALRP